MAEIRINQDVLAYLSSGTCSGRMFNLSAQMPRPAYVAVNKVLEALGGKWDRKVGAHVFADPAEEIIEDAILTGTYRRTKQDFGQFDTPEDLATELAAEADIEPGMVLLEPSCGIGNLALAAERAGASVAGYEIDVRRRKVASERCRFLGDSVMLADFLLVCPGPAYDRVLMNPPFAKQADIDHVLHASLFLKRGGVLVSVMSAGVQFRAGSKAEQFRSFVAARGGTITRLPDNAFLASGTDVSTVVVKFSM